MQLSIANSVLFTSMIQSAIQGTDSFFQPSPLHTTPKHQVAYQPLTSPGAGSSNWHITRSDTNLQTPALVSKGKLLFESMRLQSSPEDITTELQKFYQERLDGIECPDCSTTGGRNEALTKISRQ